MAAPDPLGAVSTMYGTHSRRLRVVDDYVVVVTVYKVGIPGVGGQIDVLDRIGQVVVRALKGIVERLGDLIEGSLAVYHFPICLDAQASHKGRLGPEKFGHSSTIGSCVNLENASSFQGFRQSPELLHPLFANYGAIGVDGLGADADRAERLFGADARLHYLM